VAHTSEIEKLERRYAENPKGRNFAPLADAYRKAGQLDQAIELCTSGLEHHPDYVSAHIVYGRCLIDQHQDDKAAVVFRKVLGLDPENVIAFKVLADIGARSGQLDEAVLWLTKLLAADPMNGDAAEALALAKGKAAQAPKATPAAPPPPPVAPAELELSDIIQDADPAPPIDLRPQAEGPSDIEFFDGTMDFSSVSNSTARAEGIEIHEDIVLQPQEIEVEGLAHTQYEASGLFKLDPPEDDDLGTVDLQLIMPEPLEDVGSPEEAFAPPPAPDPPRAAGPGRWTPTPSAGSPAAVTLSDDDGAADTAALSRAEPILTETIAELYLKQGHQEEALRVYQALQAQHPDDRRLRAKIAALSRGVTGVSGAETGGVPRGQTVQAFLRGILASRPGSSTQAAVARERPGVSPLDSAFASTPPDPEPLGEPTRAAADDLSLDAVFGDDTPSPGRPTPPGSRLEAPVAATTPSPPPAPAAPSGSGGGFSFDEFFSSAGAPESTAPPAAPNSAPQASGSRARPPLEEDGDLDQFQSWLKGLKT
jgi:tetratricopeptide (TPR) repeat protein